MNRLTLNSQQGSTLLEAMIAILILTAASAAFLLSSKQQVTFQENQKLTASLQETADRVKLATTDQDSCAVNFAGETLPGGIGVDPTIVYPLTGIFYKLYSSGTWTRGQAILQPQGSQFMDPINHLVLDSLQLKNFTGSNSTYFSTLELAIRSSGKPLMTRQIPFTFTVDPSTNKIQDCHGSSKSYPKNTPSVSVEDCFQQSPDVGQPGTWCAPPYFLVNMSSDGDRWGNGNYVKCCKAKVYNLPLTDGSVFNGDVMVSAARDCTMIKDCNNNYCCSNLTQIRQNDPGIWVVSGMHNTGSDWRLNDYFAQAKLSLPANTDPEYHLTLTGCTSGYDTPTAASHDGWMCPLTYIFGAKIQAPNQVVMDLWQTTDYCKGNCYPICCTLGLQGP